MDLLPLTEKRSIKTGIMTGVIFFAGMWLMCLLLNAGFSIMGVQNAAITKVVKENFLWYIILFQLKIFAAYLAVGGTIGFITGSSIHSFQYLAKQKLPIWKNYIVNFVLIGVVNSYFLVRAVNKYPQLFTELLYDNGGLRKSTQLFITNLNIIWIDLFGLLLLLVVTGPIFSHTIRVVNYSPGRLKKFIRVFAAGFLFIVFAVGAVVYVRRHHMNSGPNILFIGSDSLRYDRLSCNGYNRNTSPNIDLLAGRSVNLSHYYVSCPRTFPSFLSILSGTQPATHGIRHMFPTWEARKIAVPLLPRILKEHGYSTGVVSDFAGDIFSRINLGFDIVNVPYFNFPILIGQRSLEMHSLLLPYFTNYWGRRIFPEIREFADNGDPDLLAIDVKQALDKLRHKDKFFLTAFFSVDHFPYAAPAPYYKKFTNPGYSGPYKYHKVNNPTAGENLSGEDIQQINDLYDGSVAAFDKAVGGILRYLSRTGLDKNTIVIISADHGESLYENNYGMGHGEHLRGEQVVRPPFIIYDPIKNYSPRKVDALVESIDFTPTLLERLGIPVPKEIEGISFLGLLNGREREIRDYVYSETGIWFTNQGDQFFQKQRIMYPDITVLNRIDFDHNYEIVISDQYNPVVTLAKHRMIRTKDYKMIYIPMQEGITYEFYRSTGPEEFLPEGLSQVVVRQLKTYLMEELKREKNTVIKNDYAIPLR